MDDCDKSYNVVFNPLYRYSQFYTLSASALSVFPLVYLIFVKLRNSPFNQNVKFLYMLYFLQILISVINNAVVFAHHVIIPFFIESKCDVLVDPFKNKIFQRIGIFGISGPMLTILGISIERLAALIWARCYEHVKLNIGVLLGVIVLALDLLLVYLFFLEEKFEEPSISYFLIQRTSQKNMNYLCFSLLLLNSLNLVFNYFLIRMNTLLKMKGRNSLSTRFQIEENIITTKFSTYISFLHVFFFSLYLAFTLIIHLVVAKFLTIETDLLSIRGVYVTIPTYNLLIGGASCLILNRLQKKKVAKVYAEVALKFTGEEGAQNHDEAIFQIWNSKSSRIK